MLYSFFLRIIWNTHTRSFILWLFQLLPIKRGRVMCVSWSGEAYSCNPRAIAEYLISDTDKWNVFFAFRQPQLFANSIPQGICAVEIGSLRYFYLLATSNFVIANTRLGGGMYWPFAKRKGQFYIQTMHGGHGIKRQELEISSQLGDEYVMSLYNDALRTDLMISDSRFWTEKARTIFAYPKGEILEVGLPRNDVFFKGNIYKHNKSGDKYVIYCPTFRSNKRLDVYGFDIDKVVSALEKKFGGRWYIRISSHPNMKSYYRQIYDFSHPRIVDVGDDDLQKMLVTSDIAITDYSSAGFEFALSCRPCFLLCRDLVNYERGVYFDMRSLPFPFAETDDELIENILSFDNDKYLVDLERFNRDVIGLHETGHATEAVVEWMKRRMM